MHFVKNSPKSGPEQIEHESSGSHSLKSKELEGYITVGPQTSVYITSKLSSKIILAVDITEVLFFLDKTAVKIRR
jgi:hypothetical protein